MKVNRNFLLFSPVSRCGDPEHPEGLMCLEAARASASAPHPPHPQSFPGNLGAELGPLGGTPLSPREGEARAQEYGDVWTSNRHENGNWEKK